MYMPTQVPYIYRRGTEKKNPQLLSIIVFRINVPYAMQ